MSWDDRGALTGDGDTPVWDHPGGEVTVHVRGAFGGGTWKLMFSSDGGSNFDDVDRSGETNVTFTENGVGTVRLPPCKLKGNLAGATAPNVQARSGLVYERVGPS